MIDKIQLIIDNLNRTIEGKNQLLARLEQTQSEVASITASFLKLNVDELILIRNDILTLVDEHEAIVNPSLDIDPRQMDLPL
jgi:reverse gyrase